MVMIGLTTDPKTGAQILSFANSSTSTFPDAPGFYISSSACGAGKSTLIADLAKMNQNEGVLIIVATKKAADELGSKIPSSFVLHTDSNIEKYREDPNCIKRRHILIITAARAIIDPVELFLDFQWRGSRKYVFIDELITFYPEPFEMPDKVKDAITYVDTTKAHKTGKCVGSERIGKKTYYRHTYGDINKMRAAYRFSKEKLFQGRSKLVEYKVEKILEHVRLNGFVPINQNIIREAESRNSIVVLFDGTSDIVFPGSKKHIKLSGTRYSSDISFSTFKMPLKRKNKEGFKVDEIEKCCPGFIKKVVDMTKSEEVLLVTWKTLELFKNNGLADNFEKSIATDNFPELLKQKLVENGADEKNLHVIYRGSGLDRGSNEYSGCSTVIFFGSWNLPNKVTKNISDMFGEKVRFDDYKLSLLVQTICRTRIRLHKGDTIKVMFSEDCSYDLFYRVQEYFKKESELTCKIDGLKPSSSYKFSKPQKGFIFDLICLYRYDSKLRDAIVNNKPYTLNITLSEIDRILEKRGSGGYPRRDRYSGLIKYLQEERQVTLTIT